MLRKDLHLKVKLKGGRFRDLLKSNFYWNDQICISWQGIEEFYHKPKTAWQGHTQDFLDCSVASFWYKKIILIFSKEIYNIYG